MPEKKIKVVLHQSTPALGAPDAGPVYFGPATGKLVGGPRIRVSVDRRGRASVKMPIKKATGTTITFEASDPVQQRRAPALNFGEHLKPPSKSKRRR
jgi:hypothetical protein